MGDDTWSGRRAVCPVYCRPKCQREKNARYNATAAGRTNKEASIEAPDRGHRAEIDQGARRDKRGERRKAGERERAKERPVSSLPQAAGARAQ